MPTPWPFARAVVIGCSGAGKSTFARGLGAITGLPVVHIDQLFWQRGWVEVPGPLFRARLSNVIAGERWIIDGINTASLGERLSRAHVLFWLTHRRVACLRRVVWRVSTSYGRTRPDMAPDCPERFDLEFLRYIWGFEAKSNPRIEQAIRDHDFEPRTIRLGSDAESHACLREIALRMRP